MNCVFKWILPFAILWLGLTAKASAAELINIQFGGMDAYTGAAMGGGSNNEFWNYADVTSGTLSSLITSNQGSSNVNFTWTSDGLVTTPLSSFTGADQNLMSGYVYSSTHDDFFSFSGLQSGKTYFLYVYSQSEYAIANNNANNQSLSITINGNNYEPTLPSVGTESGYVANQNYKVYTFTSQGTVATAYYTGNPNSTNGVINGLQLSDTAPQPVPEPTTIMLFGIGSLITSLRLKKNIRNTNE
jgi:hypothetical protein